MSEKITVLVSEKEVDERIELLGKQISKDYEGRQVHLICILKGGSIFYVRACQEDYRAGIHRLYECKQLW